MARALSHAGKSLGCKNHMPSVASRIAGSSRGPCAVLGPKHKYHPQQRSQMCAVFAHLGPSAYGASGIQILVRSVPGYCGTMHVCRALGLEAPSAPDTYSRQHASQQ